MAYFNKSPLAFNDLEDIFERALASENGITITCRDHAEAMGLRTRLHYYRKRNKDLNRETYPPEHPLHNASVWDRLVCHNPTDNVLRITKRQTDHLIIEPI